MIKINVISNYSGWNNFFKNPNLYLENQINNFNKKDKKFKKKNIFFTLLLSENKEIKKLNNKFRKKNKSTDVLSFTFYTKKELDKKLSKEKEIYLGDIIINFNKIQNKNNFTNFKSEFNKLWIHGFVHLFGYDHKKIKDFNTMLKIEKKFLSYLSK